METVRLPAAPSPDRLPADARRPDAPRARHHADDDRFCDALLRGLQLPWRIEGQIRNIAVAASVMFVVAATPREVVREKRAAALRPRVPASGGDPRRRRHRQGRHALARRGRTHSALRNHEAGAPDDARLVLPQAERNGGVVGPPRRLRDARGAGRLHPEAARPRDLDSGRHRRLRGDLLRGTSLEGDRGADRRWAEHAPPSSGR